MVLYRPIESLLSLEDRIITDFVSRASKKPWKSMYERFEDPLRECDTLLRDQWRRFWSTHGQAVWERNFWAPFPAKSKAAIARQKRQRKALRAFRVFASKLTKEAKHAVCQNVQSSYHEGWWYKTKAFALRKFFRQGEKAYMTYMTRIYERWPAQNESPAQTALWCFRPWRKK